MTKSQTISIIAEVADTSTQGVIKVLDALNAVAYEHIKVDGEFLVPGLVKLIKVNRKARMGRNPATGETIKIPAKTVVKARLPKAIKDAVL